MKRIHALLVLAALVLAGCGGGGGGGGGGGDSVSVSITPTSVELTAWETQTFAAVVLGTTNTAVTWTVQEGAAGGTITTAGVYTAPDTAGTYHVVATSQADPTKSAGAEVTVTSRDEPPPPPF